MGKALIIAEKPSVALDISRALGGFKRHGDYFESDEYVLSSAVGHLLEIRPPEGFEAKRGKWTFEHLPVIPPRFELEPIEKAEQRLRLLGKLIKRKDVDRLINACDAGREGELIFRRLVEHFKATQPIQRLWLQSMTPAAIREGFERLRSDVEMQPLADAAVCRSEADWLVGINGTRAMTAFNSKGGGFFKTTVGRVQTPTLAILVEREERIKRFVPRTYWELHATFACQAGEYTGRWFDEHFQRTQQGKETDDALRAERIWDKSRAEEIRTKCIGRPGIVTEETKPSTQLSPLLFDLTSLQRDANRRFGLPANRTLQIAQALYERHKVITYPRTDARALPEDYLNTVRGVLRTMQDGPYATFAETILKEGWVKPNKRIFNNAKISDHFAIIPTNILPKSLSEPERKIYEMIVKRFLAVFYPPAEYLLTTRITRVEGEPFKSEGKVLVKPGWLEVYGREVEQNGDEPGTNLVPVQQSEQVNTKEVEVRESQTKPPPRFTEATLLTAMEGAGKLVEDDELRQAMAEKGLGTPATRAAIIEGLIEENYVRRNGNELQPTGKAFMLLNLLRRMGIEELTKPELTGEWEFKLKQMEHGRLTRNSFMGEIANMTRHIVERAKTFEEKGGPDGFTDLKTPCPVCGGTIRMNHRRYQCQKCEFNLPLFISGRLMEPEEIEELVEKRILGPLTGFHSRRGFSYKATLRLNNEQKLEFDFGNEQQNGGNAGTPVDFSKQSPLGKCPRCGASVFDSGTAYVCEKSIGPNKSCSFRSAKVILQQTIEPGQMSKLLSDGRTDLLGGFVSRRNGRKFSAFLVLKDGDVSFEFQPRTAKGGGEKNQNRKEEAAPLDFTGQEPLGKCPKCGARVFEGPETYVCERTQEKTRRCTFHTGKTILEQPISRDQMKKLLEEGSTDLLEGFVSKYGKTFKARLVLDDKGKVKFEFESEGKQ